MNILYFRRFKRLINYDEPLTFNEKLQVKKLKNRSGLLTIAADKLASKKYVKAIVPEIYIPKTLWSCTDIQKLDSLNFNELPRDYVFKANHTSQTIEIIKDSQHLPLKKMKSLAHNWLKHDQSGSLGEWAYKDIPPTVFIEEFLDFEGQAPDDYKFFVYHGKVHFIQLDSERFTNHKRNMFDANWNDLGFDYSYKRKSPSPPKPHFVDDMIVMAEALGADFDFVRVDLYFYNGMITFGELTIYPGAGFERFPTFYLDEMFGNPWEIVS
ncbi:ATP-grasp fold amidoligase family protein [Photobacterium swingsii]|uniref:ATP-grasp fold amidoligase family protein n=1 Tax=Photobacterium swingsii TaxID=680026 RepID=UPI003D131220